jgi:hypothetical protein
MEIFNNMLNIGDVNKLSILCRLGGRNKKFDSSQNANAERTPPPNLVLEPAIGIVEKGAKALALRLMGEKGVERYNQHYYASLDYNMRAKEALVYASRFLEQGDIQTAEKYLKMSNDITQLMNLERTAAFETWQRDLERVNEIEHKIFEAGVVTAEKTLKLAAIIAGQPGLIKHINHVVLIVNGVGDSVFVGKEEAVKNVIINTLVSKFVEAFHGDLTNLSTKFFRSDAVLKNLPVDKLAVFFTEELAKLGIKELGVVEALLNKLGQPGVNPIV